jgi:hypothetical protein
MPHNVLTGLSKGLPYGIEAYSGLHDYQPMFYFLQSE